MSNIIRKIAAVAGLGTLGTFLGHGMFAATGTNAKFPVLLSGSLENVFGYSIAEGTAVDIVRVIGFVDVALALLLGLAVVGYLVNSRSSLYRFATSPVMIAVYVWATVWGFMTAASRVTAAGEFYPEVWDVVERAPNFTIPVVGILTVLYLRRRVVEPDRELVDA